MVPERHRPIFARIPTLLRVLLVTLLVIGFRPLRVVDELVTVNLLARAGRTVPSMAAVRLKLPATAMDGCAARWTARLKAAGVRQIVLIEPLDSLCPVGDSVALRFSDLRVDALGRARGFIRPPRWDGYSSEALPWVRPLSTRALPTVTADALMSGQLSPAFLRGKVVIATFESAATSDERVDRVSQLLAATLEPGAVRRPVWTLIPLLLGGLWIVGWLRVSEKHGTRWGLLVSLFGFSALVFLAIVLSVYVESSLFPLATMLLAFVSGIAMREVPSFLAERRMLRRANQLVERAALMRLRGIEQIEDEEFHARIAGLAEQWHPANIVLVAQLPARQWHLKFWNNGSAGEKLIDERRRDIRRTPYCDEQGVPAIRIVRNYLAVKEMPVLVVPLMALGEIEGYVFLCGDRAEKAFRSDPTVAHHMSLELAMLMRRRRLGRATAEDLPELRRRSTRARTIAAGAQTMTEEMELMGAMVREAPMGLLLADAFGHVRMIGRLFVDWLAVFGVTLPQQREDAMLAPGTLTLLTVLEKLTGSDPETAQKRLAELTTGNGLTLHLKAPSAAGGDELTLRCRVIRKTVLSVDHVGGFVAVLSKSEDRMVANNVVPLATGDELSDFGLSDAVTEMVASANRTALRHIILEPTTSQARCIGKRTRLMAALKNFLTDSADQQAPVIVLREKTREVELVIHDLDLGVPMGAIERTMNAPRHPPAGLDSLGRLILAVEESHGSMRLADARGWGMRLVIRLHRARSVVIAGNSRYPSAVAVSEGLSRSSSSMSPPSLPRSHRPPPRSGD